MPRVITQACIGVKETACTGVCPVDCIHPTKDEAEYAQVKHLFINPDECIDCGACEAECPVSAIYPDTDVPAALKEFIAINAAHYK